MGTVARQIWFNGKLQLITADFGPPPTAEELAIFTAVRTVTAAQAKMALFNAGLLTRVRAIVAAHPYEPVRIWFADAGVWDRGNAYVWALGSELGLDESAIDALFVSASNIV